MIGTLLSAITGSLGAVISSGLNAFVEHKKRQQEIEQDKLNKEHELVLYEKKLAITEKKVEGEKHVSDNNLDIEIQKSIAEISKLENFVGFINGTLRPFITYSFMATAGFILLTTIKYLIVNNINPLEWSKVEIVIRFWTLFEVIISYWFTNRSIKARG